MTRSCKYGTILRKGYIRHLKRKTIRIPASKTKKFHMRHIKSRDIRVPGGCIKAQSQAGDKRSTIDLVKITQRRKMHASMRKQYGAPRCGTGNVIREGYMRKSYVRKSGTHISSSKVPPGCVKATGRSIKRGRKGKQLFVLQKGALTQYGYHANLNEIDRRQALIKALNAGLKPLSLYRKLNAVYVLNKNKNPPLANIYRKDADWLKTTPDYLHRS